MNKKQKEDNCTVFDKLINVSHPDNIVNKGIKLKHILFSVILMFLFVWGFAASYTTSRVDGNSMFPTLHNEDFLLVSKYWFSSPKRGDIISTGLDLEHNGYDGETVVKRVIGLPGEIVEFKNRRFSVINPELGYIKFKEDYLIDPNLTPSWTGNLKRYLVPKNEYFVLGDNREISEDSREYGTILEDNIIGKVIYKLPSVFEVKSPEYDFKFKSIESVSLEKIFKEREEKSIEEEKSRKEEILKKIEKEKLIEEAKEKEEIKKEDEEKEMMIEK